MTLSRRAVLALAGTPLLASARNASAQTWPDRPVRVIVGFPAGGSVDIFVRISPNRSRSSSASRS
jgi:tripartite-type tricarboxylate transporter receptor subunit TctC